jgi:hypothetical protein
MQIHPPSLAVAYVYLFGYGSLHVISDQSLTTPAKDCSHLGTTEAQPVPERMDLMKRLVHLLEGD